MPTWPGRYRRPWRVPPQCRSRPSVYPRQRDGVVLGLSANTAIAEATSIYLRYEGDISGQDSAHAITAGLRMSW